ncbi:MAG: hypothetical protein AC479_04460 [miscellaneous Crenarchaeota group-6 archaeon AD8-1]|nr:MAG: hypothetical protein AC479_04460 [miscellaneous Crenarchaeota group-6 archaeon AD8-1]
MECTGSAELYLDQLIKRLIINLLDIHLLRILQKKPLWGYKIKKFIETTYGIKIRHSILYPTLNELEKNGFLDSQKKTKSGRVRKVYKITEKGKKYIESYYYILNDQIHNKDLI